MLIKSLKVALILLPLIYLGIVVLLYVFQRGMLYFPSPEYQHDLDTFALVNEGQSLKINVLNLGQSKAIVYFGGNAEPVVFNEVPFAENFPEHTVYLVNYRGYGGSSGKPTEAGLFSDALALYDHIQDQHESISVFGRSLGSGIATYLGSKRSIKHLALITPYDSIVNVAQQRFPIFPVRLLIHDEYDSIKRVSTISAKVLIIMAKQDLVIPNSHSINLAAAFPDQQVTVITIEKANHNNVSSSPKYFSALKDLLHPQTKKSK